MALWKPIGSAAFPRGPMLILWGSQTGTAEGFGNLLMREARQRGLGLGLGSGLGLGLRVWVNG